jgi:glycosyltransferase involved in cell wall biosynthesis
VGAAPLAMTAKDKGEKRVSPNQEPFVSVVTPVHNTADYLAMCIESVLGQSYDNWEYVIVNNMSTDASLAIAEAYAAKDARIRVVNTDQLLPQAVNYNFALRQISPESRYCKMVQADDWLFPDCLRMMVGLAESDARIAIVSAYVMTGKQLCAHSQGFPCADLPHCASSVLTGRDACRLFFLRQCYLFGTQTTVLYRSDLVRGRAPFFPEAGNFSDSELCFDVLDSHQFGFIHQVLTYTRVGNESISKSIRDYNPEALHAYVMTKKYGQRFLTPEEYEACLRKTRDELYAAFARNMFRRDRQQYWDYNLNWLELVGDRLDRALLYRMQLRRIVNLLANPMATLEKLSRALLAPSLLLADPGR